MKNSKCKDSEPPFVTAKEERLNIVEAHRVAQTVEEELKTKLGPQFSVSVHVDPHGEPED